MKIENSLLSLKIESAILENGLRIFVFENHESPELSVQAWVKTGSIHENEFLGSGVSHFLEHMMFRGSKKFPGAKIAETTAENGGDINAWTSYGNTVYYIDILSKSADKAVKILADAMINPLFPEKAFAKEKSIILRERAMVSDNPGRMLSEKLWQTMFTVHPVKHPIIGYKEKIESTDREIILKYYKNRYSPERTFIVISGDVSFEKAVSEIESEFGGWRNGNISESFLPDEPRQICMRDAKIHFPDPLSRIALGFHVPDASHEDVPALDILSAILGQNRSARLIRRLEDELKLAIEINAFNFTPYFCGVFGITALCQPEKLDSLKEGIFCEISKIRNGKNRIHNDELQRTVKHALTDYFRNMRSNSGIARLAGNSVLTCGSAEYIKKYLRDISMLTADKITEVAEKYLSEENCTLIQMTPEKKPAAQKTCQKTSKPDKLQSDNVKINKLDFGQRIVTLRDTRLPLIDICVVVPGGVILENKNNAGISNLLSSMFDTGTKTFTEKKLASILDDNAIDLDIGGGYNTLAFSMNFHKDSLDAALEIFSSIISEPLFGEKEFKREKGNLLSSLSSRKLSPKNAAEDKLRQLLYHSHPYCLPSAGLEESVKSLRVEDLRDFYLKKCLIPGKTVFGIAGDIDRDMILDKISSLINKIPWAKKDSSVIPEKPVFPYKKSFETVIIPREQAVVMLGMPGFDNLNPDRYPFMVAMKALNGMTSKLFMEVREKSGLAYYTGVYNTSGIHSGMIVFYAGTRPDAADKVLKMLDTERISLASGKRITEKEFTSAKACLKHEIAEHKLDKHSLLFNSIISEFYGNGFYEPWKLEKILESITLKDVNRVVGKYLETESCASVIAGPENKGKL